MATAPPTTWPELLQKHVDSSFAESEDPQFLLSDIMYGPKKSRRVVTRTFKKATCTMMLSMEEYTTFKVWWDNKLDGGNGTFTFKHPISEVDTVYRFEKPYKFTAVGNIYFRIEMNWQEV